MMKLKYFSLVSGILLLPQLSYADVYLKVVKSEISAPCETSLSDALDMARSEAFQKLPDNVQFAQVNEWHQASYYAGPINICTAVVAKISASYVEASKKHENWLVHVEGLGYTKNSAKYEKAGWKDALRDAQLKANYACGGSAKAPLVVSKERIILNEGKKARMYVLEATFPCEKKVD